jgi:hypothetical protein
MPKQESKRDILILTRDDVLKMASEFNKNDKLVAIHLPISR